MNISFCCDFILGDILQECFAYAMIAHLHVHNPVVIIWFEDE